MLKKSFAALILFALVSFSAASASAQVPFVGIGDSLGEGVQSGDANALTQGSSFLNIIAWRMGQPFPLPLVSTTPLASVSSPQGRPRLDPTVVSHNLAVSGANVASVLRARATATTVSQIANETDLVLFPSIGSQIEVAEQLRPQVVACWIGSNDALSAVLATDHLDASQLTPVSNFQADFSEIASRLDAIGAKVVFGTIPDVTKIGFLVDRNDLLRLLGSSYGLAADSFTTVPTVLGIKLGVLSPTVLTNPSYVLDPTEIATISGRIASFNQIIRTVAAAHGMGIAETGAAFAALADNPLVIGGVTLTPHYLQGLFTLDGVHPGNFAQALTAAYFIDAFNSKYGLNIPQLDGNTLAAFFLTDPFIDRDKDGRITGRPGAGVIETIGWLLGVSGDTNDNLVP